MNANARHDGRAPVVQCGDLDNHRLSTERAPPAKHHAKADICPSPLAVFRLRVWARAYLWASCMVSLTDAVDVLQDAAERSGLVEEIGQDRVQEIIKQEFEGVR